MSTAKWQNIAGSKKFLSKYFTTLSLFFLGIRKLVHSIHFMKKERRKSGTPGPLQCNRPQGPLWRHNGPFGHLPSILTPKEILEDCNIFDDWESAKSTKEVERKIIAGNNNDLELKVS